MGNVQATNILNNTIDQSISILNNTIQVCETSLAQNQGINVTGCQGNIVISNVNFNQTGSLDVGCASSSSSTNQVESTIKNNFKQAADAINQALNLNPGSTTATNITSLMEQLAINVVNSYSQSCISNTVQEQSINVTCPATGSGNVTIETVNFNQVTKGITQCTQDAINTTGIKTQIQNIIDQNSSATVQPIFFGVFIVLFIIVIIILLVFGASASTWIITIIILIAIGVGVAFALGIIKF